MCGEESINILCSGDTKYSSPSPWLLPPNNIYSGRKGQNKGPPDPFHCYSSRQTEDFGIIGWPWLVTEDAKVGLRVGTAAGDNPPSMTSEGIPNGQM